jgi:chemotaxis protein methyltransferase CheR
MTPRDFQRFSNFIEEELGIKMPASKKPMLEARLQKRLRLLEMPSYTDYCDFLFSDEGQELELPQLIDVVTTNTTDFFREPQHFRLLSERILPEWFAQQRGARRLHVWSAGCSTGMEPYTLAMVFCEFAERHQGFDFRILATDISSQALQQAVRAVYKLDQVAPVPQSMKTKYLLRSKDRSRQLVRVAPELRGNVCFRRLNFMDDFRLRKPADIIFCRNVIIYFDRPTQETLFQKFCRSLRPGGHLFIGHSESLTGMDLPLAQVVPTVYRRT